LSAALFGFLLLVLDNDFDQPVVDRDGFPVFWEIRVDNGAIPAACVLNEATLVPETVVVVTRYE